MSNFPNNISEPQHNAIDASPSLLAADVSFASPGGRRKSSATGGPGGGAELVLPWLLFVFIIVLPLLAGGNELYLISPQTALLVAQLLGLALLIAWWLVRLERWRWTRIPSAVIVGVGGFFTVSALATFLSVNPYQSELKLIQVGGGLLLVYAAADILRSETQVRRAAWALLWSGAIVAAYGVEQGIFGLPNWLVQAQANRASHDLVGFVSQGRIFSTFLNVNAFAAFLVMVLPVGGYLLLRAERPSRQVLAGVLLFFIIGALAMTGSKGGWAVALAVMAGTALVLVRRGEWLRLTRRVGFVALTAFLLVGFLWTVQPSEIENPMERLFSVTMGVKESAQGRWSYWKGASEIIAQHPLVGTGPGTFGISYQQVQTDGHYSRYVHNLYLQMTSESGFLGLLTFLGLVGTVGALGWQLRQHRELGGMLMLGGVALLLHGLVDFSWEIPANQWLFFILCGMVLALWRLERGEAGLTVSELSRRGRLVGALVAVPVAVMLVVMIGRPYLSEGYVQSAIAASIADDTDEAIELAAEAVSFGPRSAKARNFLATAYRRQWERSNDRSWLVMAREHHERAVELVPTIGRYHHEHGKTLWALGEEDAAIEAWRTAHQHYPIDPAMSVTLAQGLWVVGEDDEAVTLLHGMARTESAYLAAGNPDILPLFDRHFLLAKIYDAQGKIDQASMEYERIIALSERSPERIALGPLLAGRIAIEPKLWYAPRSYLEIGDLYRRQGMENEALVAYREALRLDSNFEKAKKRIRALQAEIDGKLG